MLTATERSTIFTLSKVAIAHAKQNASAVHQKLNDLGYDINHRDDKDLSESIYGFDVHHAARALAQERDHMRYLERVAGDADNLLKFCKERELPIIAILPERVWTRICLEAELYTLWPDEYGKVYLSLDAFEKYSNAQSDKVNCRYFWGLGPRKAYDKLALEHAQCKLKAVRYYLKGRKRDVLLKELFPNYSSAKQLPAQKVEVKYPIPDATFGEALAKVRGWGMDISITLQGDAIDISGFIDEKIAMEEDEFNRLKESKKRMDFLTFTSLKAAFRVSEPDPILVIRKDGYSKNPSTACAVIAQYGDWPFEFSAIEQALKEDLRM